jgi:4-hydroxythreonine-4-phosphate dehydrogenase
MGDPAGIGPEIVMAALAQRPEAAAATVVLGDSAFVERAGGGVAAGSSLVVVKDCDEARERRRAREIGPFFLSCTELNQELVAGQPHPAHGAAALDCIRVGADSAAGGDLDGLVTAPVSKEIIAATEPVFAGHTEYLARRAGVDDPLMVFVGPPPAVALLTTHLPLATALVAVHRRRILAKLRSIDAGWSRWFGVRPRIGVAGLNPHAGEGGILGGEEQREMLPAIGTARSEGIQVAGPFAADSIFREPDLDVVLCMYHDQGTLIAKRAPGVSVNCTFGLPYPRTSPDHGVAYGIAGKGVAEPDAMIAALELCLELSARR